MARKNVLQVFEHQKLIFSKDGPFKEVHWRALAAYAEKNGEEYFTVLGRGIKFSNYVGVIQAQNLTIEILPKIDSGGTAPNIESLNDDPEKILWREVLLDMLWECRLLQTEQSNKALLKLRNYTLLEIYIYLFLEQTEKLLREGLVKRYSKKEGNQLSLKGQLFFSKHISENVVHQERFYVKYSVYGYGSLLNRLLYKTLLTIRKITNNTFLTDYVNRLLFSFPELTDIKVNQNTFSGIQFDRKSERYKEAIQLSKMILLHFHPDITGGEQDVMAILFDMNSLWEEFVYRRLKREEKNYDIQVLAQQSEKFWKPSAGGYPKTIRPDIVINYTRDDKDDTIIIDTKWKKPHNLNPSDEDLKQMFVYNLYWKCANSYLLYPGNSEGSNQGDYIFTITSVCGNSCSLLMLSVLDGKKLDQEFGKKVVDTIIKRNQINL